ncbi:MAG: hypothetical protein WDM89_08195 [Rhizomicrobium sp.]
MAGFGGPNDPIAWTMQFDDDRIVPTPYLQRTKTAKTGRMASLFQWTENGGDAEVDFRAMRDGGVEIRAHGSGFNCQFRLGSGRCRAIAGLRSNLT